jgi:hypothetical protein
MSRTYRNRIYKSILKLTKIDKLLSNRRFRRANRQLDEDYLYSPKEVYDFEKVSDKAKMKKTYFDRQYYNRKITELIGCSEHIKELVEKYPQQRFGQIICNYIYPEYRTTEDEDTLKFMKKYFDIPYDPFFEESSETYNRLNND